MIEEIEPLVKEILTAGIKVAGSREDDRVRLTFDSADEAGSFMRIVGKVRGWKYAPKIQSLSSRKVFTISLSVNLPRTDLTPLLERLLRYNAIPPEMLEVWALDSDGCHDHLQAKMVGWNIVQLVNIPICRDEFGLNDRLKVDCENRVVRVIARHSVTRRGYLPKDMTPAALQELRDYLKVADIPTEHLSNGLLGMALPLSMSNKRFKEIVKACPLPFELF